MELVTFKLQGHILKKVDKLLKPFNFNNRTEFIREAIREKLYQIEIEHFVKDLEKYKGKAKTKTSDEELEKIKTEISEEYLKKYKLN